MPTTTASFTAIPMDCRRELYNAAGAGQVPIVWDMSPGFHPICRSWVEFSCVLTADPATIDPVAHTATGATLLSIAGNKVAMAGAVFFSARARRKPGTTAPIDPQVVIFSVNSVEVGRLTVADDGGTAGAGGEIFGFCGFSSPSYDTRFSMNGTNDFTINPTSVDPSLQIDVSIAGSL